MNKAEHLMTVTVVQILLLKYKPNYNSNKNSQSNGFSNQIMFAQRGENGYGKGDGKENGQISRRNMDRITCNDCGEKVHYAGKSDFPTQAKLKEDIEAFSKMKQDKYSNKPPGGGDQKALVNVKDASCSLLMGTSTE